MKYKSDYRRRVIDLALLHQRVSPFLVPLILPVNNVKLATALLLIAQFLCPIDVGYGRLLGVPDCWIYN